MKTRIITFWLNKEEYRAVVQVHTFRDRVLGVQIVEVRDRHNNMVKETEEICNEVRERAWEKVNEGGGENGKG